MAIRIVSSLTIDLYGDGATTQMSFSTHNLTTPNPIISGLKPTGLGNVKMVGGVGGVTGSLSSGRVTLTFDTPPPLAPPSTKIIMELLYGPAPA